ncbi:MAG: hypothetical protein K0U84_04695 [Actinomycetia bacterium]|nr:hypothetical protein [Actinomycetes bacterium]
MGKRKGKAKARDRKQRRRKVANTSQSTLTATITAWEDSILPVTLQFPPPLVEHATDPTAFEHQWQFLTYAFGLPDPSDFPKLPNALTEADRTALDRYVAVCTQLAGYSAISHQGGITIRASDGKTTYEAIQSSREALDGTAVRFRQLHTSGGGDKGFDVANTILNKHAQQAQDSRRDERIQVLALWGKARKRLKNRTLKNIVARKVLLNNNCPEDKLGDFANYEGFKPDEMLRLFHYGDLVHHGDRSPELDDLAKDPFKRDYYEHIFMVSLLGLSHLYFGYALLVRAALPPR